MTLDKHWDELDEGTKRESVRAILDQSRELQIVVESILDAARAELDDLTVDDLEE